MKVFIAVPTFENISPETFKSIYGLDHAGHHVVFDYIRGYDCAAARNNIAQQTLNESADYVLMLDSDMVLPSDALVNLLDNPVDVCLGVCPIRTWGQYSGDVSAYKMGEFDYVTRYTAFEIQEKRNEGEHRIKIHGGGMACAMINANVFRKLGTNCFKYVNYDNGSVLSEDLYFCEQCGQNGIDIYVDSRVNCGHIFRHVQWPV